MSLLLYEGDEHCDGSLVSLSLEQATFRQQTPKGELRPTREIVKKLN